MLESDFFKELQRALEKSNVKNTVVISGWKDSTPSAKKEFDFLIISLALKAIIHVEVKRTLNKDSKDKAQKQLNDGVSTIRSKVPFQKNSNWKYFQYICYSFVKPDCQETKQYIDSHLPFEFKSHEQICDWWKNLTDEVSQDLSTGQSQSSQVDATTYLNILKYLFHQMFIQGDVLTPGEVCLFFYHISSGLCALLTLIMIVIRLRLACTMACRHTWKYKSLSFSLFCCVYVYINLIWSNSAQHFIIQGNL